MRSPFDGRGSITEQLLRFSGALVLTVIALLAVIWFLVRWGWILLVAGLLIAAAWLIIWLIRLRSRPWR